MTNIEWGTPPPDGRTNIAASRKWQAVADALRSRPGEWAKVADATTNVALSSRIRSGAMSAFRPAGAFEVTARRAQSPDGKHRWDVWARYVGDSTEVSA